MPYYCPVCRKYSDKYSTEKSRDDHLVEAHPTSEDARHLNERRRKGYGGNDTAIGKTTEA